MPKKAPKKVVKKAAGSKKFWRVGKNYFIRTVTNYITGRLVKIDGPELVFLEAAWVADTGRFADMFRNPDGIQEVEPYPASLLVLVNRTAICDAVEWPYSLPATQK